MLPPKSGIPRILTAFLESVPFWSWANSLVEYLTVGTLVAPLLKRYWDLCQPKY